MKDSRTGTYGVLSLVMVTGLRWICYTALLPVGSVPVIAAAALSRTSMPVMMLFLPQARKSGLSHSVGRPGLLPVMAAVALVTILGLACVKAALGPALIAVGAVTAGLGWLASHKIGGQTGDVLGATQQICEAVALMVFVVALT